MKKSAFLAILGLATGLTTSCGQGYIWFSSYQANGGNGATTSEFGQPVYSSLIGIPFQAELYYALGTVADPVDFNSFDSIGSNPTGLSLLLGVSAAYDNSGFAYGPTGLGFFDGSQVSIPGYTGGPITFEVVAFNGTTYDTAPYRGRSGSFTMSSIPTQPSNYPPFQGPFLGDYGQPMPSFVVTPEPATLALVGLGLGALLMFRRKQP